MKDPIIYAVGDVHGRADHLERTLQFIESDARYWGGRPVVYFLGDIVDRGPGSRQALELVRATLEKWEGSKLHLGNHDDWFLKAVQTRGIGDEVYDWQHCGGVETVRSFYPDLSFKDALLAIADNHGELIRMIAQSEPMTSHGSMIFCHAGVDRFAPLDRQEIDVLTWIRSPFLEIADSKMPVVVHGHTIFRHGPVVTDNRISLDTGCFMTDRLSTLRVNPTTRTIGFIVTSGSGMIEVDEADPHVLDRGSGTALDRIDEIFDNWKD